MIRIILLMLAYSTIGALTIILFLGEYLDSQPSYIGGFVGLVIGVIAIVLAHVTDEALYRRR